MDKNYEIRLETAKLMHDTMIDMSNENAYMAWIWEMPDCPMEEDFEWFAEDEERYARVRKELQDWATELDKKLRDEE